MSQVPLRQTLPFERALSDQTGGQPKVFRRDYLDGGLLPVIDQGAAEIAGYTDDVDAAYRGDLPVLLFGDHTRAFKYVDFPFALGADGVKVLQPAPWYELRFLYYYLLTNHIPGRGYSRHFKFLKQVSFPFLPRSEQRRIVEILDQADRLRRLRAEADAKADRILPALLAQTLGSPSTWRHDSRSRVLGDLVVPVSGATPSKANGKYWNGKVPWVSPKDMKQDFLSDSQDHVSHAALHETNLTLVEPGNALIVVRGMILARDIPVALNLCPVTINQDMKALVPKSGDVSGSFLWAALRLARAELQSLVRTAGHGTRKLDTPELMQLPVLVPRPEQLALIDSAVGSHRVLTDRRRSSRSTIDRLFAVLASRAFEGSLTAGWREAHMKQLLEEIEHQAKALAAVR